MNETYNIKKLKRQYWATLSKRVLWQILSYFVYPVIYLFRNKILKFTIPRLKENTEFHIYEIADGYTKRDLYRHPYFWMWLFLCGNRGEWVGESWYMKEKKLKWFKTINEDGHPIPETFKEKLLYAWLSYKWAGVRNAAWNSGEWFFEEGKFKEGTLNMIQNDMPIDNNGGPVAKFKDASGEYRDNAGPYIRYPFDYKESDPSDARWHCTREGERMVIYTTHKGNLRYDYNYCKIYKVKWLKRFFILERQRGWNSYDGLIQFHWKNMTTKIDALSEADYNKYLNLIS